MRNQKPVDPVPDHFGDATCPSGHDGYPGGGGLHQDDAEPLTDGWVNDEGKARNNERKVSDEPGETHQVVHFPA